MFGNWYALPITLATLEIEWAYLMGY
jgi:hypothetical protein